MSAVRTGVRAYMDATLLEYQVGSYFCNSTCGSKVTYSHRNYSLKQTKRAFKEFIHCVFSSVSGKQTRR